MISFYFCKKFHAMKKTFTKKLAAYTGAAGAFIALGSASEAKAQAVYTDVNPDEVLYPVSFDIYDIDFNNDAISEFSIETFYIFSSYSYTTYSGSIFYNTFSYYSAGITKADNNFGILGTSWEASALANGDIVNNSGDFLTNSTFWNLGYNNWGNFPGAGDKYIGVHFTIGTDVHYGWILVNMVFGSYSITVKGFAYESQPEVGIMAGDIVGVYMNLTGVSNLQPTSADVEYWPSKTGTAYYVVQLATDPEPDKDQMKAGTGAIGATVANFGNAITTENIASAFAVSGLTDGIQYTLYSVIESNTILSNVKSIDFTTTVTDVDELFSGVFSAFPSPADDFINVQMPLEGEIKIMDLNGKVIFSTQHAAGTHNIDVSALTSGMYFIHFTDIQGNNQMVKFVKK